MTKGKYKIRAERKSTEKEINQVIRDLENKITQLEKQLTISMDKFVNLRDSSNEVIGNLNLQIAEQSSPKVKQLEEEIRQLKKLLDQEANKNKDLKTQWNKAFDALVNYTADGLTGYAKVEKAFQILGRGDEFMAEDDIIEKINAGKLTIDQARIIRDKRWQNHNQSAERARRQRGLRPNDR